MAAVAGKARHKNASNAHVHAPDGSKEKAKAAERGSNSKVVLKLQEIEAGLGIKDEVELPWIKTPKADMLFGLVIFGNAGFIGLDLEFAPDGFSWGFWAAETVFLMIFLIELVMRMVAECPKPWQFFARGWAPEWWGIFDFTVTILGCVDAWVVTPIMTMSSEGGESPMSSFTVLRVFRLLRLARLIRVLRMFNELVVLVQTLANSMRAVGWMSLLLGMIIYTGSIICVIIIAEPNKDNADIQLHFGTLGDALFSHFCVVTLEAWPDIAQAAMQQSPAWALYFVGMITLTNFALVNLMVGVIVERIIHFSMEQETELSAFVAESAQFRKTLEVLFSEADFDANGTVTREEIRALMMDERTHEIMTAFGINLDIPPHTLFTIMGIDGDGATSFEVFFNACMRLCGSKQSIHSMFVQHDICQTRQFLCERIEELGQHMAGKGAPSRRSPSSNAMALPNSSANPGQAQASPEDCITELMERMDRFGQVQLQICAEIEALKTGGGGQGSSGAPGSPLLSLGPTLRPNPPRDLGSCCVDSLFSRRKETTPRRERSEPLASGKQTRKELEAEFRKTKK